jgi:hypothetical protein
MSRFIKSYIFVIKLTLLAFPLNSAASNNCPPYDFGVTEINNGESLVVISVSRSRIDGVDGISIQMAKNLAELKAKKALMKKSYGEEHFSGLIQEFECIKDSFVYIGIRLDPHRTKQANTLSNALQKSIITQPTLIPKN